MQGHMMLARAALQPRNGKRKQPGNQRLRKPIHADTYEEMMRRIRAEFHRP